MFKDFVMLLADLETMPSPERQVKRLIAYFGALDDQDLAWALFHLSGRKFARQIRVKTLTNWAIDFAGIDASLFAECKNLVGDSLETASLILGTASEASPVSLSEISAALQNVLLDKNEPDDANTVSAQRKLLENYWSSLNTAQIKVLNQLICGRLKRVCLLHLLAQALSASMDAEAAEIETALESSWQAGPGFRAELLAKCKEKNTLLFPEDFPELILSVGAAPELNLAESEYLCDWSFSELIVQLAKQDGAVTIWSSKGVLLNKFFPELIEEAAFLPDGVTIEGEIAGFRDAEPISPEIFMARLKSEEPSRAMLARLPAAFFALDLLRDNEEDLKERSLDYRILRLRYLLSMESKISDKEEVEQLRLFAPCLLQLSRKLRPLSLIENQNGKPFDLMLADCRKLKASALRIREKGAGRRRWYLCKPEPLQAMVVLCAAMRLQNSHLLCEASFAVKDKEGLSTVARICLDPESKIAHMVDEYARANTVKRLGPMHLLKPSLLFELSYEQLFESNRKQGSYKMHNAQVLKFLPEKNLDELSSLSELLSSSSSSSN